MRLSWLATRLGRPEAADALSRHALRYLWRGAKLLVLNGRQIQCDLTDTIKLVGLNRAGYGIRSAYLFGLDAEPELRVFLSLLRRGDTVLDVGARIGLYSLTSAEEVGNDGLVFAFEPDLEAALMLHKSIALNNFSNVYISNAVLDVTARRALFESAGRPDGRSLTSLESVGATPVLCIGLDQFVDIFDLGRVAAIKMDVEGSEQHVIDGGKSVIERDRPIILLETAVCADIAIPNYTIFNLMHSRNAFALHKDVTIPPELKSFLDENINSVSALAP